MYSGSSNSWEYLQGLLIAVMLPFMALFGHVAMSGLIPLCAAKQTCKNNLEAARPSAGVILERFIIASIAPWGSHSAIYRF
jgi:hypothetical protein